MSDRITTSFPGRQEQFEYWSIVSLDEDNPVRVSGQFNTQITRKKDRPKWVKKAGIAGGTPWLRHTGTEPNDWMFEFRGIAMDALDNYPATALAKLEELASVDAVLGRPHLVRFTSRDIVIEGFITELAEAPLQYWENPAIKTVREVGPMAITITERPTISFAPSTSTAFLLYTDDVEFEDIARLHYGDARYSWSLREHNQGAKLNDQLEIPRKSDPAITLSVDIRPTFDFKEVIEGL